MTGILADTVQVECIDCGCLLLMPSRLATEAPGPLCFGCRGERDKKTNARETRKSVRLVTGENK